MLQEECYLWALSDLKGYKEIFQVMEIFIILFGVVVTQVYTIVKTRQTEHL